MPESARTRRVRSPPVTNYGIAVLSVAAAAIANVAFNRLIGAEPSASLFLCAIMLAAWVGGTGPALLAALPAIPAYAFLLRSRNIRSRFRSRMFHGIPPERDRVRRHARLVPR